MYIVVRLRAVMFVPGVYIIYEDWWTISESSQNVLYTLRTFDGCVHDLSSGAPGLAISFSSFMAGVARLPSSVYGTHDDASICSSIAGLVTSLRSFEKCGSRPMLRDQALEQKYQFNILFNILTEKRNKCGS